MPLTSHGSTLAAPPRKQRRGLGGALRTHERAGFASARVVDARDSLDTAEPLGELVELRVGAELLRFPWGRPWELGTAAFWAEQTRRRPAVESYALGDSLVEEVAACVLGGYGMPAAIGLAAFRAVRDAHLLAGTPNVFELEDVLLGPLTLPGRTQPVRYRFAAQRARRLAGALATLRTSEPPQEPLALREWLIGLPGIGPKTASWIVRNHCGCDAVAIVDVHVHRAGLAAGFFSPRWRLPKDYGRFELAFCDVAQLSGLSAAALDGCIWDQLQSLGPAGALLLAR